MNKRTSISLLVLAALSYQAIAEEDHPLFSAYPGADVDRYQRIDYDQFELPNGAVTGKQFSKITTFGEVTRHVYDIEQVS